MSSPYGEMAISDALRYGSALLKVLSRNDVGATGSNQAGYLLPVGGWDLFTPHGPIPGRLDKHKVHITWQDGRTTTSVITWYSSKKEYRLTGGMSGDFPWRTDDDLGSLLVLVRRDIDDFCAYVLDSDDDIQEIQTALGVELPAGQVWTAYRAGREETPESADECISRRFREFVASLGAFPAGQVFSQTTVNALRACCGAFASWSADTRLIQCIDAEYRLFRLAERQICGPQICRLFADIDDFLKTASSVMNRRKSRAGRSLENHVEMILKEAGIPFDMRPQVEGAPDILIPGKAEYENQKYPVSRLFTVGIKTTCKDRWRQVVKEAPRVRSKHIVTLQKSVSCTQLELMRKAHVRLVVPKPLHKDYPRASTAPILDVGEFIDGIRCALKLP